MTVLGRRRRDGIKYGVLLRSTQLDYASAKNRELQRECVRSFEPLLQVNSRAGDTVRQVNLPLNYKVLMKGPPTVPQCWWKQQSRGLLSGA